MGFKVVDNLVEKMKLGIPLSIGEAVAAVKKRVQLNKETKEAHKRKEFPTHYTSEHVPDHAKQQRFLEYAMSFIHQEYPFYWHLLMTRMQGFTNKQIAVFLNKKGYNTTEAQISRKEAEAIRIVKDKIEEVRRTGIPIFEAAGISGEPK